MDKKDILVLYFCSVLVCFIYLFFLRNTVKNDLDFMLWLIPGISMVFLPVFIVKLKEVIKVG